MLPFFAFEKMALGYVIFAYGEFRCVVSVSPFISFVVLKKSPVAQKMHLPTLTFQGRKCEFREGTWSIIPVN